jgi:hypothetical protein
VTVTHVAVSALAWLPRRDGQAPDLWTMVLNWNRWDAGHYVRIADSGYHLGPGFPAFFPLYPLLVHIFDFVLPGDALISALVVANAAAIGALTVLHRLAEHEFGPRVAQRAAWYLAAFPTGFFLFIGYNESLFLLLAVGALYAGRRGHWWLAGVLGGLSSAARLFGVLLVVPLAVEYLRQISWASQRASSPREPSWRELSRPGRWVGRIRFDVLGLALVPLGVVAYSLYCWAELGNPLAFSVAQDQWGRHYTLPGGAWVDAVRQIGGHRLLGAGSLGSLVDAGTTLVAVVLLVLCVAGRFKFRRDQLYLVVQAALTLVLLMSTEVGGRPMQSAARYVLEAVAVILLLARLGANQIVDRAVLMIGVALQAVFLVVFMAGTFLVA